MSIANKPADTIKASSLSIDVNVSDDRSAPSRIAVQLVLQQVVSGKLVDIEQRPFAAGTTRFELAGLANAEYRVELIARDEAGNLSEAAQARFTVDAPPPSPGAPSTGSEQPGVSRIAGGCSAAPASEPSWLALLLLLLVATLAVRRRRGSRR